MSFEQGARQPPARGWPKADIPLRLAPGRFWGWGAVLAVAGIAVIGNSPNVHFVDFPQFWAAAKTVGTPDLLDPVRHAAWEIERGIVPDFFPYMPGMAWLLAPFGAVSMAAGFWLFALAMTLVSAAAAVLGARVFGLDRRVALVATFAWAPCTASIAFGQNGPLLLLFALIAIEGLRRDDDWLAGLGTGLLLYKPTIALPLLGLMLLRRRWRALGVVCLVAAGWYVASAAAAGDWAWPRTWIGAVPDYFRRNVDFNTNKESSLPSILVGFGVSPLLAWGLSAVVVLAALPRLLKAPLAEAAAGACLLGLAVSPHSLNYEAPVALPAIFWAMSPGTGLAEPWRTRLIVATYLLVSMHLISTFLGLSSVAIAVVGGAAIWIGGPWRLDGTSWRTLLNFPGPRRERGLTEPQPPPLS